MITNIRLRFHFWCSNFSLLKPKLHIFNSIWYFIYLILNVVARIWWKWCWFYLAGFQIDILGLKIILTMVLFEDIRLGWSNNEMWLFLFLLFKLEVKVLLYCLMKDFVMFFNVVLKHLANLLICTEEGVEVI